MRYQVTFLALVIWVVGCMREGTDHTENQTKASRRGQIERLAGDIDREPSVKVLERGKVLMSYSDCFTCHKENDRKRGPAFHDIAARYPMNSSYIRILSQRIIQGARGAWGNTVMPPHPTISDEDAETMVMYILSLDR